jgi:hypothetical protein
MNSVRGVWFVVYGPSVGLDALGDALEPERK